MGRKKLYDGAKIYDTPKGVPRAYPVHSGYNGGFDAASLPYIKPIGSIYRETIRWERRLYEDILTAWKIRYPGNWDYNFTNWVLFRAGWLSIVKPNDVFGIIPQNGTISGYNVFYQPTRVIVSNPAISGRNKQEYRIGKDCAIIKLTHDWFGIWDEVHQAAETLAGMEISLRDAIENNRIANIVAAKNKAAAQTLTEVIELVRQGQPTVVVNSPIPTDDSENGDGSPWHLLSLDVGRNYIVDKCIADMMTYYDNFRERFGIPALSEKKERRTNEEVAMVQSISNANLIGMKECLDRSLETVYEVFPELSGKISFELREGVADGAI